MGAELRAREYPSASVFNWRQPALFLGQALAPNLMRALLAGSVLWVIVGTVALFSRARTEVLLLAVTAQIGAAMTAMTDLGIVLPETWAGLYLAASTLAYARGHARIGAGAALGGLFLRELVMPYVVWCVFLAIKERRTQELAVWGVGLTAWAVAYAIHASVVAHALQPGALAHPTWVQCGGLRFVLATIAFGGWLYLLPTWSAAFAFVLLASSVWAPLRAWHVKGAVGIYLAFFAVVGQSFNQGWGLLTASTWALAYGFGVQGLTVLLRQAR
jgi:hypothetical protein